MLKRMLTFLLLCSVVYGVFVWYHHPTPCRTPVLYTVGAIDPRFQIDERTVSTSLRQAEALWESAVGRQLFVQTPDAPLTVHLVFDTRQHATQVQQRLLPQLQRAEALHASMAQSYGAWRALFEDKRRTYDVEHTGYQHRSQAYQTEVRQWHMRGDIPLATQRTLDATRAALEASRVQLRTLEEEIHEAVTVLRGLEERERTLLATHTRQVQAYNRLSRAQQQFHKGEFNGRRITVYQYRAAEDLVLVLAHELGHALGLKHVADERAVMHELLSRQDLDPPALTTADRQAVRTACGVP